MNKFTIFRVQNGWIVLRGEHDLVATKDTADAWVFTNAQQLVQFLAAAARE